jgi:hypothetical protein
MNKEILIITGVLVGSFLVANHLMKPKAPKMAEKMSNASGCGCGGSSNFGGCCGS